MAITNNCMIFSVIVALISVSQCQINYTDSNLNNWACSSGLRQSPIEFNLTNSTYSEMIGIISDEYQPIINAVVQMTSNNLIEVVSLGAQDSWGYALIQYSGYVMKFDLKQIVVHSPPEHTVDYISSEIEIQLIHQKDLDYTNDINKYQAKPDISEFLVISIPYAKNAATPADGNLIEILNTAYSETLNQRNSVNIPLDTLNLVRGKRFFFYQGSQTFYPCNESHLHLLISDITSVSPSTLNKFKSIFQQKFLNSLNTKKTTGLGARAVIRNFFVSQDEAAKYEDPITLAENTKREESATAAKAKADAEAKAKADSKKS